MLRLRAPTGDCCAVLIHYFDMDGAYLAIAGSGCSDALHRTFACRGDKLLIVIPILQKLNHLSYVYREADKGDEMLFVDTRFAVNWLASQFAAFRHGDASSHSYSFDNYTDDTVMSERDRLHPTQRIVAAAIS